MNLRDLPLARQNAQLRQSQKPLYRRRNRTIPVAQLTPEILEKKVLPLAMALKK